MRSFQNVHPTPAISATPERASIVPDTRVTAGAPSERRTQGVSSHSPIPLNSPSRAASGQKLGPDSHKLQASVIAHSPPNTASARCDPRHSNHAVTISASPAGR